MLKTAPAVFAVENEYQIMVPVTDSSLFFVRVGDRVFHDSVNGVNRSACAVHRVRVPRKVLDRAKGYTVCETEMLDRVPYGTKTGKTTETDFVFRPVKSENIRLYHMADTHHQVDAAIRAAKAFGRIDLLVMNGDIVDCNYAAECFDVIYEIASAVTGGEIPIVFARGNHDLRGGAAELAPDFLPTRAGLPYYTFRLGKIWGIVLDCGEDKADEYADYVGTVDCRAFRLAETEWLKSVWKNDPCGFSDKGVALRLIVSHRPFTMVQCPPFDIEQSNFAAWAKLLKRFRPDWMLSGHIHECCISPVGGEKDHLGQPCPIIIGSKIGKDYHAGCGLVIRPDAITVSFPDSTGAVLDTVKLPRK